MSENDALKNEINDLLVKFNTLTDEAQKKINTDFETQIESKNTNELVKLKTSLTKTITELEEAAKEPVAPVVEEPVAPVVEGAQEGGSRRRKSKKSKGRKTKKGKKRKTRRKGKKSSKRRK